MATSSMIAWDRGTAIVIPCVIPFTLSLATKKVGSAIFLSCVYFFIFSIIVILSMMFILPFFMIVIVFVTNPLAIWETRKNVARVSPTGRYAPTGNATVVGTRDLERVFLSAEAERLDGKCNGVTE